MDTLKNASFPPKMVGPELFQLALPPSCIEFCPAHPDYFLVGTYNLQEGGKDYTGTGNVTSGEEKSPGSAEVKEESDDEQQSMPAKEQSRNGSLILFRRQDNQV